MNREEEKTTILLAEMSQSSHHKSIASESDLQPKPPIDDNSMNNNNSSAPSSSSSSSSSSKSTNNLKARSCKGCLYYSSNLKANSHNPLCVGLPRSLPNVPPYLTEQSEMEASKEQHRSLTDFRYACVGYSVYLDHKGQSSDGQEVPTELPACVGLEVLVDRRFRAADSTTDHVTPIHNREDGDGLPQRRSPRPANSTTGTGDDFFTRFTRNANLVASGVVKNMRKVGNQIKQSLDDIVNPYRGRPK